MTKEARSAIYITGLNDADPMFQKFAIKAWRIYGVEPVFFQSKWASEETFQNKLTRLINTIDEQTKKGDRVSLFAVSAGASLAVAAYANMKDINSTVFVCGKLRRPEAVGEKYYTQNPAFRGAMENLNANVAKLNKIEKSKILSIAPLFDETVTTRDTKIDGAKNIVFPTLFHVPTIALAISLLSFIPILFMKRME